MSLRLEESDEDGDSLFGSPPPSPQLTGRASPTLALPSMSGGSRASTSTALRTQNVGTIALPGSHPDSELPINPLALSLNHGIVHRPPAPPTTNANPMAHHSVRRNSFQPVASTSQSLITPFTLSSSKSKPKKRTKKPSRSTTPQPRGPEFALPDPAAPPPTHFLRNQENLLGKAGVVAGLKPSAITHARGSTPSNPILVDDDDTPKLGRQRSHSHEFSQPYIDPALLTAPTNQEIVSVLIGQKDIFPILQGVLKLVVGNIAGVGASSYAPLPPTGFERRPSSGQPTSADGPSGQSVKKRKLNRVPAGASDWDVPYPFQQGEGPDAYHKTWERERGKQLISQLIKLIKSAARKAATKKYLQQEKERKEAEEKQGRNNKLTEQSSAAGRSSHYKPEAANYGIDMGTTALLSTQLHDIFHDSSNASQHMPSKSSTCLPSHASSQQQCLPETGPSTLEEMLNIYTHQGLPSYTPTNLGAISDSQNTFTTPLDSQTPASGLDSASLDSWMTFFVDTFPASFGDSSNQSLDSNPTSHCSTPGPEDFAFSNLFNQPTTGDPTSTPPFSTPSYDFAMMLSSMLNQPQTQTSSTDANSGAPPTIADQMIDPSLLALSSSSDFPLSKISLDSATTPTTQAVSPIASTSSFSGNDPATPASVNWDTSLPDVFMAGADDDINGQGMWGTTMWNNFPAMSPQRIVPGGITVDTTVDFGPLPEVSDHGSGLYEKPTADKGKGRAVEWISTTANVAPSAVLAAQDAVRALLGGSPPPFNPSPVVSTNVEKARASRKLRKEEVIKRAQAKRQRLQEELNRVKMQLWETTIEHAGLLQLVRQLDGVIPDGSDGRVS